MQDVAGSITWKDREYRIVFNLNVMEAIQAEYGSLDAWGELTDGTRQRRDDNGELMVDENGNPIVSEVDAKAVIFGFTQMLNEGIDIDNDENGTDTPFLTHRQVGRMITDIGLNNAAGAMNETVIESSKVPAKNA